MMSKFFRLLSAALLALGLIEVAVAQGPDRERGLRRDVERADQPERRRRLGGEASRSRRESQPSPLFAAMDVDNDGVLSSRELRNARASLQKLDADGDGNITMAEASNSPRRGGGSPDVPGGSEDPNAMIARIMENDRNGDGQLSPDEVPPQLGRMLADADTNNDRVVDRTELEQAVLNMQNRSRDGGRGSQGDSAEEIYRRLMAGDANGDGLLSPKEVPPRMMRMLRGADLNDDGFLNNNEVRQAVRRMSDRGGDPRRAGDRGRPGPPDRE